MEDYIFIVLLSVTGPATSIGTSTTINIPSLVLGVVEIVAAFSPHPPPQSTYLLNLFVSGHRPLHIALLLEPWADRLKWAVSTAPAVVIHTILHVVVVAVYTLHQIELRERRQNLQVFENFYCIMSAFSMTFTLTAVYAEFYSH